MKSVIIIAAFVAVAIAAPAPGKYEPISVGPALVDTYEPISVGPALVDTYEPISVGPAIVEGAPVTVTGADGTPLVQIIINVNRPSEIAADPVDVEDIAEEPLPEVVILPTPVFPEIDVPEPVELPSPVLPEVVKPVIVGTPIIPAPAVTLPETLN